MKKVLSLILALALIAATLSVMPMTGSAVDYKTGSISYTGDGRNYYYTDSYFESPASLYNPSLATMSAYAALSNYYRNATADVLTTIGFTDIVFNDDYSNPDIDTMGTIIAHKTITANGVPYTLIIADTSAGTAMTEWAGNFTLGVSGNHKGFNLAAEEIMRSLNDYVERYSEKFESNAVKVWTMGYSRSAAASNLFAAKLTDDVRDDMKVDAWGDEFTLTTENIYAYTFETPIGGSTDNISVADAEKNYTNIHNIVNPADLVTMVAPTEWGFVRYGVDENVIPSSKSERYNRLYDKMLEYYFSIDNNDVKNNTAYDEDGNPQHILNTFTGKKLTLDGIEDTDISVEEFLDSFYTEFSTAIGSRSNYASEIEPAARKILYYVCSSGIDEEVIKAFADSFKDKIGENYGALLTAALAGKEELYGVLDSVANEAADETGFDLFSVSEAKEYIEALMPYVLNVISADIIYSQGKTLLTLLDNITVVLSAHYPELCIAWLECQDTNYNPDAETSVPEYCVYEKVTTVKVGNYTMTLDGVSKNITVTANSDGFSLYSTADGRYIGLSGTTATLTDTPFCWHYNGGFYALTRSTLISKLFSQYGKTYITFNSDGFGTASSKKNITITETVRSTEHTPTCTRIDNQTHTVTCANCNAVINACASHTYNGDSCSCGQLSADAAKVNGVSVTASKLFKLFVTTYKVSITADSKYSVSGVQYSLDGGSTWKNGNTFTVKKSVPNFDIKITDAVGNVTLWTYNSSVGTATLK